MYGAPGSPAVYLALPLLSLAFVVGVALGLVTGAATPSASWVFAASAGCACAAVGCARLPVAAGAWLGAAALLAGMGAGSAAVKRDSALFSYVRECSVRAEVIEGARPALADGALLVRVTHIATDGAWKRYERRARLYADSWGQLPLSGDVLELRGSLRPPRSRLHEYAFDPRRYARARGLAGSVIARSDVRVIAHRTGTRTWIDAFRQRVERQIFAHASDGAAPILVGMLTGSRREIDAGLRDLFSASGIAHVLAVSGLHLGLFCLFVFRALAWTLRRSARVCTSTGSSRPAALITIPFVFAYVTFAGAPPSAVRAGVMAVALLVGVIAERPASALHALSLAVVGMLSAQPLCLMDAGFQLSVIATLSLVLMSLTPRRTASAKSALVFDGPPGRLDRVRAWATQAAGRVRDGFEVSVVTSLATAPVLAWHFGSVPVLSPLPNLVVAAGLASIALPLSAAGSALLVCGVEGGALLVSAASVMTELFVWIARTGEPVFALSFVCGRPGGLEMCGWCVAATFSWASWRRPKAGVVAMLTCALLVAAGDHVSRGRGELWIHAIPVGQGDCTLIELPNGLRVLIDAGGRGPDGGNTARWAVLPYLHGIGASQVDVLVMTHGDADHIGGLIDLVDVVRPREIWAGNSAHRALVLKLYRAAKRRGVPFRILHHDTAEVLSGEVRVDVLPPMDREPGNDGSLVLRFCYREFCALMTGDIEEPRERDLVRRGAALRADYLKVAHHGSRSSTTEAFVDAVQPTISVYHAGRYNRFGFPHEEPWRRLRAAGSLQRRTDRGRAVVVRSDGRRIFVE